MKDDNFLLEDSEEQAEIFSSFEEAKTWALNNPGKSFSRSPDGDGFIKNK